MIRNHSRHGSRFPITLGGGGYSVAKSLRFRSSASAYLNRTAGTPTAQTKYTISVWVKRGTSTFYSVFSAGSASAGDYDSLQFNSTSPLAFFTGPGVGSADLVTTQVFRDFAAWYHIIVAVDTTQATASNRVLMYVNGTQITSFSTATYPSLNATSAINRNGAVQAIGALYSGGYNQYLDGELAEFNFVDGQALAPTSFGAYSTYNQWLPIRYAGTYGTNGFYLPFTNTASTSTLVADSSGNANNWTPNNISLTAGSTYDSLTDVPTLTSTTVANYAVLNPLQNGAGTLSGGNLNLLGASAAWGTRVATIAVTSGKWYFEATPTSGSATQGIYFGITQSSAPVTEISTGTTGYGYYGNNGQKYNNNIGVAYGATVADNDVVGVAFDVTAGTLTFYKNNVSQGVAFSGLAAGTWFLGISCYGTATCSVNFGQQPFTYTAPTGFLPLNTFNI